MYVACVRMFEREYIYKYPVLLWQHDVCGWPSTWCSFQEKVAEDRDSAYKPTVCHRSLQHEVV